MPAMEMDGPRCITLALRYRSSSAFFKEINRFKFLQGYLDIVRWLCEQGGAAIEVDALRGVDARSKGGWTPLSKLLIG